MKKNVLKKMVIFAVLVFTFMFGNVYAASITGNSTVKVGETITVTFNFGFNVGAFGTIDVNYNSDVLEYVSGDSLHEDVWVDRTVESLGIGTKTYTFKALKEGNCKITVVANDVVKSNEAMDEVPTVTAEKLITVESNAPVEVPPVQSGDNNVVQTPTTSGNNYLRYLQIDQEGISPYFSKNVTDYSLTVGENVDYIEVLARAEDSNARVEISGNTNLKEGENRIDIKVTAPNGYYRIYTIVVTKAKDKEKANAYLESIIVENFSLDRLFQSEVLEYNLGDIPKSINSLNVVAIAKDQKATIEIEGADKLVEKGNGEVIIKVTAQDGSTVKEYKIKYNVVLSESDMEVNQEMTNYLVDIEKSTSTKDKVVAYIKYLWFSIKKNYLLVLMYILVIVEFIYILVLRKRLKNTENDNDNPPDDTPSDRVDILKVEKNDEENHDVQNNVEEVVTAVEEPKAEIPVLPPQEDIKTSRKGSLEKNIARADGIKLVDLDKDEGPKDELVFNIFENLTDDDIKRMLDEQVDSGDNK